MSDERAAVFVEHVRRDAEIGWVLIPLDGKVPRSRRWQQSGYDAPELAAGKWVHWGKTANLGVLLGASGLAVVEDDTDEGRARLLELCGGELPCTPTALSGGRSTHLYFHDPGRGNTSRDGLELRAGAQQIVLPPSVHPDTGRAYRWVEGREPWTVPLGEVPPALLDYFTDPGPGSAAAPVAGEIHQPGRHRAMLSLAGSMRHRGMTADEIAVALLAVNASRCKPPLPDSEVVKLARDVAHRYSPAPPDVEQERIDREAERLLNEREAEPETRRQPAPALIVSLVEFLGGSQEDASWLVDHLAAKAALVIVAGLPKVGKSTFVYGMLGALTGADERFIGLPAASTAVLLLTEEPPSTVEEKVDRFGLDEECVYVLSKRRVRSGRKWAKIVEAATEFCREHPEIGVCVIDVIDKFADWDSKRSEADTGVIRETIDPLYELLDLGVCVILITHQRKAEGEFGLRVRGGTALVGSADVVVEVERPSPAAGLSKGSRVVKIVSRFAGAPDEIAVELDDEGWRSLGTVTAAARRSRREEILDLLNEEPLTLEEIVDRAGLADAHKLTVRRRLNELVELMLAERFGAGKRGDPHRWGVTEGGQAFRSSFLSADFGASDD